LARGRAELAKGPYLHSELAWGRLAGPGSLQAPGALRRPRLVWPAGPRLVWASETPAAPWPRPAPPRPIAVCVGSGECTAAAGRAEILILLCPCHRKQGQSRINRAPLGRGRRPIAGYYDCGAWKGLEVLVGGPGPSTARAAGRRAPEWRTR
jgi:hypothetical protein